MGEKCGNPVEKPHRAILRMRLPTQDQDEDREKHQELECQRSAQQTLLGSVLGENLEDLHHLHYVSSHNHAELEC